MQDERLGISRLSMPDGREVALQFTWARIDAVGREWIVTQLQAVMTGKPGCQAAMTELLVLASGGEIKASEVLTEDAPVVGFEEAYKAIEDAWLLARFGPTRKASGQPENPPKSRPIGWRRFFRRS